MKHIIDINDKTANCQISIKLDDDCRNGHEDFSVTATFWRIGMPRTDRYFDMGGCCHDEILRLRPALVRFTNLHLCDFNGAPMYAVSNGFYHLKHSTKETFCEYMRVQPWQYETLKNAEDEKYFHYLVQSLGLPALWKMEADAAIHQLEVLTGTKFVSTATKSHFSPLSAEDVADIEQKIASGYYSPEQIAFRAECKRVERMAKYMAGIKEKAADEKRKADEKATIALGIATVTNTTKSNFLYYDHKSELVLNWQDYGEQFTTDEIEAIKAEASELFPFAKVSSK